MTSPTPAHDTTANGTVRTHHAAWFAVIALVVGLAVGAAVTGDDTDGTAPASLTTVQASCRDWTGSSQSGMTDDQWCTDMFRWMDEESGGSMMGSMMWRGTEQMGRSCRAWVAEDRDLSDAAGRRQCDAMVAFMDGHMGRGGGWMMQGS